MKRKKDINFLKSFAGKRGSASRWANHKKIVTKQIRIHQYDYDIISILSSFHDSFASVVSASLRAYCKCHNIKYSPPSWVD